MLEGRTTYREREQRVVDQLMRYHLPDGRPMFTAREQAHAALRRWARLGHDRRAPK